LEDAKGEENPMEGQVVDEPSIEAKTAIRVTRR
jgi:hypothetical protein